MLLASLVQARLEEAFFGIRARYSLGRTRTPLVTGIWRSSYAFDSADPPHQDISEHFLVLRQRRGRIIGRSLRKSEGSEISFDLRIEGSILVGEWREYTSKGRLYRGAVSFQLAETHDRMDGRWVGYSRSRGMRVGPWELRRETRAASRRSRRRFRDRRELR